MRKPIDIKFVTTERRRNYLVSEANYETAKFFTEHLLAIEMKRNRNTYEKTCLFRTFSTTIM